MYRRGRHVLALIDPAKKPSNLQSLHLLLQKKAFPSSWAFFIASAYPSALSPAPNGKQQAAPSADE